MSERRKPLTMLGLKRAVLERDGEIRRLHALIADLADPDPCYLDHHGYCQTHGWLAVDPPCPHERARKMGLVDDE